MKRLLALTLLATCAHAADGDATSEQEHVAPEPPAHLMHDMSYREMSRLMGMDDRAATASVVVDELERHGWDVHAWYGGDYSKLWLRTAGEHMRGGGQHADVELLFDRVIARWWSLQAGGRHDFGDGPSRDWLALGMQGLAPYFIDVQATAYVGEGGRAALRIATHYDLLFTQRLILRPSLQFDAYNRDGLSQSELGLRLRYEIRREIAPYVGLSRVWGAGGAGDDLQFVVGVRFRI